MRLTAGVLLVGIGLVASPACRREPRDVPASVAGEGAPPAGAPGRIVAADLAAYRRGVEREVALVRAAIATLRRTSDRDERAVVSAGAAAERTSVEGARAAGLPVDRYRQLIALVDSLLLLPRRRASDASADALGPATRVLDSLRIDLVVARSRLSAESERRCIGGPGSPC